MTCKIFDTQKCLTLRLNDPTIIPVPRQFLTPKPDLDAIDPEEMYDMRQGPSKAINPNLVSASWTLRRKGQDQVDEIRATREQKSVNLRKESSQKSMRAEFRFDKSIDPKKRWFYQKKKSSAPAETAPTSGTKKK